VNSIVFPIDQEVEFALRASGWAPDRKVPIEAMVQPLIAEGFKSFRLAEDILRNVGGLTVLPRSGASRAYAPEAVTFDPLDASGELDRVLDWGSKFEKQFFPLGECLSTCILLVSTNGEMFAGTRGVFYKLGTSLGEALNVLVLAKSRPIPLMK
jgi:hypothetical protein